MTTSGQKKRMSYTRKADALFSAAVRSRQRCEIAEWGLAGPPCSGALQCCHIISRRYRAIRWDERNALCGCQAHHTYYTHRPLEWDQAIIENLGVEYLSHLRAKALADPPEDPKTAFNRLSLVDLQDRGNS
jgi:hypothetical protein